MTFPRLLEMPLKAKKVLMRTTLKCASFLAATMLAIKGYSGLFEILSRMQRLERRLEHRKGL